MDERPRYLDAWDEVRAEIRRLEQLSADDDDPGALVDDYLANEGELVAATAMRLKLALAGRAESMRTAWDALLAGDGEAARDHLARALHCNEVIRETGTFGDFSLSDGALETTARKHGIAPTDARVWRSKHSLWAEFWMDVGRSMERAKRSGRRHDLDSLLADLTLAAEAKLERRTTYGITKSIPDEREARRRRRAAERALATMRDWINAI